MADGLEILSQIIGWTYFAAWSVSFYPQLYSNYRRKSVQGLSIDFLNYNVVGFVCYSIYNVMKFFSKDIQKELIERDGKVNLVAINDVVFAIHALVISSLTLAQSFYYKRDKNQGLSFFAKCLLSAIGVAAAVALTIAFLKLITWLDVLYIASYIKLLLSLVKYCPQAFINFKRKSTVGWSIQNILLDFTGGILSIIQLFLDAARGGDWVKITGNIPKLLLGNLSIVFDVLFMTQHYILYRHPRTSSISDNVSDVESGTESLRPDNSPKKYGTAD